MHTYPWHVGDYLKDCAHLTDDEDLAYRRLLDLYYTNEGPIPDTQSVTRRIRMGAKKDVVARVLKEFFERRDGFWYQKRAQEEIERYQKRSSISRANGAKSGGRPKQEPGGNPAGTHQPPTRTRTRTNKLPPTPQMGEWFEAFYAEYPVHKARQDALKAWLQLLPEKALFDTIMAALKRQLAAKHFHNASGELVAPYPATWLRATRWTDEVGQQQAAGGDWWATAQGLRDKGNELGIPAPDETPQGFLRFKAAVWVKAGDGPWWDHQDTAYQLAAKLRDQGGGDAS